MARQTHYTGRQTAIRAGLVLICPRDYGDTCALISTRTKLSSSGSSGLWTIRGGDVFRAGDRVGVLWHDSAGRLRATPARVVRVVIADVVAARCRYRVTLDNGRELLSWGNELATWLIVKSAEMV